MKKLILAAFALTTAASVFAQGTIFLHNRATSPVAVTTHVYAPLGINDMEAITGNTATETPAGTANYGGRLVIGATAGGGLAGQYGAQTTFAQYVAAVGADMSADSLLPVGQTTTFRTGGGAGFIREITSTLTGPGYDEAAAGPFTFAIVAWDNFSGLYPTWAEAAVAWKAGTIAAGMSTPFNIASLGGGSVPATFPGTGVTSFNLYFIPEPSSMVLAGLGAAALLIFRRRN